MCGGTSNVTNCPSILSTPNFAGFFGQIARIINGEIGGREAT